MDAITNEEVKKKLMLERFQEEVSVVRLWHVYVCVSMRQDTDGWGCFFKYHLTHLATHIHAHNTHAEPGLRFQQRTVQRQRTGPAVVHGGCKVLSEVWVVVQRKQVIITDERHATRARKQWSCFFLFIISLLSLSVVLSSPGASKLFRGRFVRRFMPLH